MQSVIKKVEPYIEMEEFTPDNVAKVSRACKSICMWVRAMYIYHNVALQVEPKRQALAAAQADLDETMAQLDAAQGKLKGVQDKIVALEASFDEAVAKKAALAKQVRVFWFAPSACSPGVHRCLLSSRNRCMHISRLVHTDRIYTDVNSFRCNLVE